LALNMAPNWYQAPALLLPHAARVGEAGIPGEEGICAVARADERVAPVQLPRVGQHCLDHGVAIRHLGAVPAGGQGRCFGDDMARIGQPRFGGKPSRMERAVDLARIATVEARAAAFGTTEHDDGRRLVGGGAQEIDLALAEIDLEPVQIDARHLRIVGAGSQRAIRQLRGELGRRHVGRAAHRRFPAIARRG
jgi:hypothetical protein